MFRNFDECPRPPDLTGPLRDKVATSAFVIQWHIGDVEPTWSRAAATATSPSPGGSHEGTRVHGDRGNANHTRGNRQR